MVRRKGEFVANVAFDREWDETAANIAEQRAAPRFTTLIRTGKLITPDGEFVCVLRDVSSVGVRLRCFHPVPTAPTATLELQNGETFAMQKVREEGLDASFAFAAPIPVETLVYINGRYPRRPIRLALRMPVMLRTVSGTISAETLNISQQGCRVEAALPMALAQAVTIESQHLPTIRAKVCWRRGNAFGLVFDDTFSLKDFALHAARLQSAKPAGS